MGTWCTTQCLYIPHVQCFCTHKFILVDVNKYNFGTIYSIVVSLQPKYPRSDVQVYNIIPDDQEAAVSSYHAIVYSGVCACGDLCLVQWIRYQHILQANLPGTTY